MKKLLLAVFVLFCTSAFAQSVSITNNGSAPDGSAMLDIQSTTSGLLIPRMTAAQRTAISSPATGLMVYQTDGTAGFYYYNGITWITFGGSYTETDPIVRAIVGIVKSDGTTISAATAGTDYIVPGGNLGTPSAGDLTNCTFPTLNQNTTGTAATVTTNANLTGMVTSVGNATTVVTNANLTGDVTSTGNATTVGKINGASLAGLTTGILKNTTSTGVPSIAVAADFPTLNQNTTGTAATVTTNANLTGMVTSVGNATTVVTNANLTGDVTSTGNATTVGKINGASLAGLTTGILKNTTSTGVPSIAVAADFPTLNQNTTGTAATVTTNANLTGMVTSVGNATTVVTNANLTGDVTSTGNATTVGKINGTSLAGLTTGILKNTTSTGVPSIAVAADFPTLNQNTTGTAGAFTGSLSGDVTGTQGSTTVGKINGASLAGLTTGILKNTTSTGVPSIAVAADFPTLNQNTTGTASNVTGTVAIANGGTSATDAADARNNLGLGTAAVANTGTSNGDVPVLNVSGKIPDNLLDFTGLTYDGSIDLHLNPTITVETSGHYYIVSVAGTETGSGITFQSQDWMISNGTTWEKISGSTAVSSVAGKTGIVLLAGSDITSGTVAIANGGTGASTQQSAINALTGTQSSGKYLRSDGTNATLSTIQAADIPALNQNTTGTAGAFTGSLSGDVTGAQSATVVGKINGTSLAGLTTGILKNTTSTGVPSIAVAADFPTLNQNTTGSAGTFTGSLSGDVTGTQGATALSKIAGTTLTISSLASSNLLQYNGSNWVNVAPSSLTFGNFSGSLAGDVTGTQSATVVGKINGTSLAGLATGILKNTTSTGVPSIAVAADFPTLNQNTTGSAANVTGTVAVTNGGTGTTTGCITGTGELIFNSSGANNPILIQSAGTGGYVELYGNKGVYTNCGFNINCGPGGSYMCQINGNGYLGASGWAYLSDKNLKENIKYLNDSKTKEMDNIMKLMPSTYDYIKGEKKEAGFMAQDVQSVYPDLVVEAPAPDGKGTQLGMKTTELIPYMVKGMQEQQVMIEELKKQVAALQVQLGKLQGIK